jgi:hypothetical protein
MEDQTPVKIPLTPRQKRLLRLVYVLGGILAVMFVFVLAAIAYQVARLK